MRAAPLQFRPAYPSAPQRCLDANVLSGTSSVSGLSIELDNRACNGGLRRFDALLEERSEDSRELLSESHEVERHEHSRQGRQLLGDSPVHSASAVPIVPFKVMKTDCGLY